MTMNYILEHFLLVVLLIAVVFTVVWISLYRKRLHIGIIAVVIISVLHVLYGVFCVKAFAFLESGAETGSFSKMSIFGAVFFMPVAYFFGAKLTKRKQSDVFDIFTICTVFTLACSRVNCLVSGCCSGIPFFGMNYCWPTREIEIVYYFLFIILLAPRILKGKTNGEVYPLYMLSYGALRFLLEFVRVSSSLSLLHLTHLWAAIALILGLSIYLEQLARQKRSNETKIKRRQ